jgi:hypothetical protein
LAAGAGLVSATLAWLWTEQWLIALAVGLGAAVLVLQTLIYWSRERLSDERAAVLELLQEVSPLLASGEAFSSAIAAVARQGSHPATKALANALDVVFAGAHGQGTGLPPSRWPLANLLFQLTLCQRNAITLFFGIVLVAGVIRAGPFITALIETAEGRGFVGISAALVIWGRIVLNRLAEMLE